ncbi:hypothetical protein WJX72_002677 [[Myrmecia] bisecta]|uniref:Uncharacterized protein n=1 Tax=[Myrmecia] bisecta TaxID=41462 RepID=A0AAW1P1M2_9CHLO
MKTSLNPFLTKYMPSQLGGKGLIWAAVKLLPESKVIPDFAALEELKGRIDAGDFFTIQQLQDQAREIKLISGKWIITTLTAFVDDIWSKVAQAVMGGKLDGAAKVSQAATGAGTHSICVYTVDYTNKQEILRLQKALKQLGVVVKLHYEPDLYTILNIKEPDI